MAKKAQGDDTQKRGAGRPPLYDTPDELAAAINDYFLEEKQPTLAGLTYSLGFCDRSSLDNQGDRGEEYSYIIKKAKMYIQSCHERGLYAPGCTGHIFWLKNFAGYVDKQDLALSGELPSVVIEAPDA